MDFYSEPITGWRLWIYKHGHVQSFWKPTPWPRDAPLEARCVHEGHTLTPRHTAPAWHHTCGVYAHHSLDQLSLARYAPFYLYGTVHLWGRVIVCERGYRAQYAYPREVWCGAALAEQVAEYWPAVRVNVGDDMPAAQYFSGERGVE